MVWVLFFNVLFTLNTSFAYRWPPKRISGWCAPLPPQLSHKHCMPEFIWNLKKIRGPCLVVFLFCEMCVCVVFVFVHMVPPVLVLPCFGTSRIVMLSHSLRLDGAPMVLLELGKIFRDEGLQVHLLSGDDGPLRHSKSDRCQTNPGIRTDSISKPVMISF